MRSKTSLCVAAGVLLAATATAQAAQPVGPSATSPSTSPSTAPMSEYEIYSSSNDGPKQKDLYDDEGQAEGRRAREAAIGVHVGEWNALAPKDVYGALAFFEWGTNGRLWSNVWRVSVSRTLTRELSSKDAAGAVQSDTKLTFTTAQLEGCPLWIPIVSRDVVLRPCLFVGGGVVEAKGEVDPGAQSHVRPWVYAGGLFRLRYRFAERFAVEVQTGVLLPFIRDRFGREGNADVYQADSWIPFGSVGLSVVL